MICPKDTCDSTNIESLPHYWESLPAESPLRGRYAPPAVPDGRSRLVLAGAGALGAAFTVTGQILAGLLLLVVGAAGAVFAHRRIEAAEAERARWSRRRICLACTNVWVPE